MQVGGRSAHDSRSSVGDGGQQPGGAHNGTSPPARHQSSARIAPPNASNSLERQLAWKLKVTSVVRAE